GPAADRGPQMARSAADRDCVLSDQPEQGQVPTLCPVPAAPVYWPGTPGCTRTPRSAAMPPLDASAVRRYRTDGYVSGIPVLTSPEVAAYRAACDQLEVALGGKPRTVQVRQMHLHFRRAYELASHPHILDAVESILGPDLLVWGTELFAKHARDPAIF